MTHSVFRCAFRAADTLWTCPSKGYHSRIGLYDCLSDFRKMQRDSRVTIDAPAVTEIEISDPTAVNAGIELIDQDAVQLQPMPLRARRVIVRLEHEFHVPQGIVTLQADPDGVRRLFDWGKRLTTTAARQPVIFNERKDERGAAEVELFETLLSVLGVAEQLEPTRSDRTRQAHSDIVSIAERHALSQLGEPLSVTDLCRVAGVSERTLQYAFRNVMGLTPVAYLIRLRLHRVREGLLAGTHATTTVSAEALNWGFWHFGEFSRAYMDCFGELPSDTLRRAPDGSR